MDRSILWVFLLQLILIMKMLLMKLSLWIGIALIQLHGSKACLETKRIALLEIKTFFISARDVGFDDEIRSSWFDADGMSSDCCNDWEGVKCNATTWRVTQLSLNQKTKINYSDYNSYSYGVSLLNMSLFHPFEELQCLDLSDNWFKGFYENKIKMAYKAWKRKNGSTHWYFIEYLLVHKSTN